MQCTDCGFTMPYDKAPEIDTCSLCGTQLRPSMEDILVHGLYNIVKETRPSQVQLAKDVEALFQNDDPGVLMAEGGTGIGKSFAYLIPALLHAKGRVIISTAKKSLQSQLAEKDVPFLIKQMGLTHSCVVYKGKANYACWKLEKEVPMDSRAAYKDFIDQAKALRRPADLSDWKGIEPSWWKKISIDNCPLGTQCSHYENCRPNPKAGNIVITNHHLTSIDMKITPGTLLGEYTAVIFDEAHHVPDAFRSAFKKYVSLSGVTRLRNSICNDSMLKNFMHDNVSGKELNYANLVAAARHLDTTFTSLHRVANKNTAKTGIIDYKTIVTNTLEVEEIAIRLGELLSLIKERIQRAYDNINKKYGLEDDEFSAGELLAIKSRVNRAHSSTANIVNLTCQIGIINDEKDTSKHNYIIVSNDKGIQAIPIDIGKEIAPRLDRIAHKVITSATLAVGTDFTYTKKLWGFDKGEHNIKEGIYLSSFDFHKQTKLYLPLHLPLFAMRYDKPGRRSWVQKLSNEIAQLVSATEGNAFVLFASRTDMEDFTYELKDTLGYPLILQEGDTTAVLRKYLNTPKAVLFGLKSFWEGIDVPGNSLKLVIIPRLPFPNPYDPVISTMSTASTNGFKEISIPQMIFDMKQGVGRLIRTKNDRGIVAILDVRAWTGTSNKHTHQARIINIKKSKNMPRMGYGKLLLDELGLSNFHYDFTEIMKSANKLLTGVNER